MKKAIVIGASSGMGYDLSKLLSAQGYEVGLVARRVEVLDELAHSLPGKSYIKQIDISQMDDARILLNELIEEMAGIDLIVVSSGIGGFNIKYDWEREKGTLDVNVAGFTAMVHCAAQYFIKKGSGHIVGISSIAEYRGNWLAPAYAASKAYVSIYLEGLRQKVMKESNGNIYVTDLVPGYVDTPMTKEQKGMFWLASSEKAAKQMMSAIKKKKKKAFITKRWRIIPFFFKRLPDKAIIKFG